MAKYTIIESRDPFEGDDFARRLAPSLAAAGNDVAVFLVDNGVFAARSGVASELLSTLNEAGVEVFADDFALAERGISGDALASSVKSTTLDTLVDQLAEGRKTIWH
jgi:sulfur relay (sulfurtransferase) complex TusBCD TusD component (DsrE family)